MKIMDSLNVFSENPVISLLLWFAILVVVLYAARTYAHRLIRSLTHFFHGALRLAARSLMLSVARIERRNKEVLLATGADLAERKIEREYERINAVVTRDLQAYPAMHRSMSDLVTAIDEDYRESTEVPPTPPGWINAVDAVARIPSSGDTMVSNMLGEINRSLQKYQKKAIEEYRNASRVRNSKLSRMMPYWRKTAGTLAQVNKTIMGLVERSKHIDSTMEDYGEIISGSDRAVRRLSSSSLTQFFISGIVLLIAIGGAIVNFNLIALPLSEMVGGAAYLGPFKMSNVAALVIILVEAAMGVYLMEALHITKLFPIIGNMDDKKRRGFMWTALTILLVMACIESSLAFMRDMIAEGRQALIQSLAGVESQGERSMNWIPMVGQMVMGFVLPFALAFVAIPFESFVHSSRTVLGVALAGLMRAVAFLLRLAGNIALYFGNILINLYDLLAFPLLIVEKLLRDRSKQPKPDEKQEA